MRATLQASDAAALSEKNRRQSDESFVTALNTLIKQACDAGRNDIHVSKAIPEGVALLFKKAGYTVTEHAVSW